ncbi:hypothetical protein ACWC24_36985 [Streptomyces sp. NPDC001443]
MGYELRAQYAEDPSPRSAGPVVEIWHMTEEGETQALCGQPLDPAAWTQPSTAWGTPASDPFCRECGVRYLRTGVG